LSAHGHGPRREHFEHGADIGVRGFGPTRTAAFGQAALALVAVVTDPFGVAPKESVDLASSVRRRTTNCCSWPG
jgi:tRNA nucleotidyltransferase (CCA-adding enzyme)